MSVPQVEFFNDNGASYTLRRMPRFISFEKLILLNRWRNHGIGRWRF